MENFDVTISNELFKISRQNTDNKVFNVFNHTTCHVVHKSNCGKWESIEHRFGTDRLPVKEIGDAIDHHYGQYPQPSAQIFINGKPGYQLDPSVAAHVLKDMGSAETW